MNFDELYDTVQCHSCLTKAPRNVRREWDGSRVSEGLFPTRTHALDALESSPNRFGDFYFSVKIMIFEDFQKILENPWFWVCSGYPGWFGR